MQVNQRMLHGITNFSAVPTWPDELSHTPPPPPPPELGDAPTQKKRTGSRAIYSLSAGLLTCVPRRHSQSSKWRRNFFCSGIFSANGSRMFFFFFFLVASRIIVIPVFFFFSREQPRTITSQAAYQRPLHRWKIEIHLYTKKDPGKWIGSTSYRRTLARTLTPRNCFLTLPSSQDLFYQETSLRSDIAPAGNAWLGLEGNSLPISFFILQLVHLNLVLGLSDFIRLRQLVHIQCWYLLRGWIWCTWDGGLIFILFNLIFSLILGYKNVACQSYGVNRIIWQNSFQRRRA